MSDIYKEWFNIPEDQRPPTYYQLLGVKDFESDADVIDRASRERIRFLRDRQLDLRYENEVQRLLTEVSRARVTLRNPKSKDAYDRKLRGDRVDEGPRDIDTLVEQTYHCLDVRDFETMRDLLGQLRAIEGSEAEERRRQERLHDIFDKCMLRARHALDDKDYDEVMIYTEEALGIFPEDSAVHRLRQKAQSAMLAEEESSQRIVASQPAAPHLKQHPPQDESVRSKSALAPLDPATDQKPKTFIAGIPVAPGLPAKLNLHELPPKPSWAARLFLGGCLAASAAALTGAVYLWVKPVEPKNIIDTGAQNAPLKIEVRPTEPLERVQPPEQDLPQQGPAAKEEKAKATYNAADVLLKAGERDRAKKAFESLIQNYPQTSAAARARESLTRIQTEQEAKKLYEVGRAAFALKDYDTAIYFWTRLIEKYPDSSFSEKARGKLRRAKEAKYNQQAKQLYNEAERSRGEGRLNDARKKLERLRDNFPDWENMRAVEKALMELDAAPRETQNHADE